MQKFLKDESLLISKINELYQEKRYEEIGALRNEVFNNLDFFKKTDVIFQIISSLFVSRHFNECVTFAEELKKNEIEELKYIFYLFASLIALNDIYMAKSYINRSNILNTDYIKSMIEEDGANYSNIRNVENIDDIPCLLLLNYILSFDKEGKENIKDFDEKEIRVYKYFEMIDNIYSFNYDEEIVSYMINIASIIFEN